jgi:hypothetical protein
MLRPKPWLKMWASWQHDTNLLKLTDAEVGLWWRLYTLAHDCSRDGRLLDEYEKPLDRQAILNAIHVKTITSTRSYDSMIAKRLKQGAIQYDGETLVIINYVAEQSLVASDTPDAIRDRVTRYRQRKKDVTPNPLQSRLPNVLEDISSDNKDKDTECNAVTSVTGLGFSPPNSLDSNEIAVTGSRDFVQSLARLPRVTDSALQDSIGTLWADTLREIQKNITRMNFTTWFEGSCGQALDNRTLVVAVKSQSVAEHLSRSHISLVEKALSTVSGQNLKVSFCVQEGSHD